MFIETQDVVVGGQKKGRVASQHVSGRAPTPLFFSPLLSHIQPFGSAILLDFVCLFVSYKKITKQGENGLLSTSINKNVFSLILKNLLHKNNSQLVWS